MLPQNRRSEGLFIPSSSALTPSPASSSWRALPYTTLIVVYYYLSSYSCLSHFDAVLREGEAGFLVWAMTWLIRGLGLG